MSGRFEPWQFNRFLLKAAGDFPSFYTQLGVLNEPTPDDFAYVTHEIASCITLSLGLHDRLLAACLESWYKALPAVADTSFTQEVYLEQQGGERMCPASRLCWADIPEWEWRCAAAGFEFCSTTFIKFIKSSICGSKSAAPLTKEILQALADRAGLQRLSDKAPWQHPNSGLGAGCPCSDQAPARWQNTWIHSAPYIRGAGGGP